MFYFFGGKVGPKIIPSSRKKPKIVPSCALIRSSRLRVDPKLARGPFKGCLQRAIGLPKTAIGPPKAAQEPPKRGLGPSQGVQGHTEEAPRRHRGGTEEAPGRHQGGIREASGRQLVMTRGPNAAHIKRSQGRTTFERV